MFHGVAIVRRFRTRSYLKSGGKKPSDFVPALTIYFNRRVNGKNRRAQQES